MVKAQRRRSAAAARQPQAPPKYSPDMLVKIAMIVPVGAEPEVLLLASQIGTASGRPVKISMEDAAEVVTPGAEAQDLARAAEMPQRRASDTLPTAQPRPRRQLARVPARAVVQPQPAGLQRNSVVYRVLNPNVDLGNATTKVTVFNFVKRNQACTARDVINGTGLGLKQVQSALHGLRTMRAIESVAAVH